MSEERYKNGKIYTIRYRGDDALIYVGSTCLPLYKRWYQHKHNCFNENHKEYNYYFYQKIRETNDFENWYIELYEECSCDNKEQLLRREGEITREIGTLNSLIAGRTIKEWLSDNKEKVAAMKKEYRENSKEIWKEYGKNYYTTNKETLAEKQKKYYEERKEIISEQRNEKILCDCGCSISKRNISTHKRTKKHLDLINLNSNENNENS